MAPLRGNCTSTQNGVKKRSGKENIVNIPGFSENLLQARASEVIKECELSQG